MRFGSEGREHVTVVIFDARDIERFDADTFVGESGVGVNHFLDADFAWSKAEADDRINLSFDAERTHEANELFGSEE